MAHRTLPDERPVFDFPFSGRGRDPAAQRFSVENFEPAIGIRLLVQRFAGVGLGGQGGVGQLDGQKNLKNEFSHGFLNWCCKATCSRGWLE